MENTLVRGSVYDQIKTPVFSSGGAVTDSTSAANNTSLLIAITIGAVIVYLIYANIIRHQYNQYYSPENVD